MSRATHIAASPKGIFRRFAAGLRAFKEAFGGQERAATNADGLLAEAIDAIPDGFILYDADDRMVMANKAYRQIYSGLADLLVPGAHVDDIARAAIARHAPGEHARLAKWLVERREQRSDDGLGEIDAEGRRIRRSTMRLTSGGFAAIHSDITADKQREAELARLVEANALLVTASETTAASIIISDVDQNGRIVYVNPGFTAQTGIAAKDALGRRAKDIFRHSAALPHGYAEFKAGKATGQPFSVRVPVQTSGGSFVYFDVYVSPIRDETGRIVRWVDVGHDVTAQVVAEQKLRDSEEQLRKQAALLHDAIEALPDGFVLFDAEDRFVLCNQRFIEIRPPSTVAYTPGISFADLVRGDLNANEPTLTPAEVEAWVASRMEERRNLTGTRVRVIKIGKRWTRISERRTADGGLASIHADITDVKNAEAKAIEGEERLRNLAANIPGVVFQRLHQADGREMYTYASDYAFELSGYTAEEWLADASVIDRATDPEFVPEIEAVVQKVAAEKGAGEFQFRFHTKAGEKRWGHVILRSRLLANGDLVSDGVCFDITHQKKLKRKQRQLENQLRHAQRIEALGTLAGGIAHDVNNTLVPILALSKMTISVLAEGSRERESMQTILDASYRIRDLVAQILAFSRKESAKLEPVALAKVVNDAVRLLKATVPPNIHLSTTIDEPIGEISADEAQLVQVLMNLCTNAAHAIGANKGAIAIHLDQIAINSPDTNEHATGYARLKVIDDGSGMDQAVLQRIFEPFFTTKGVGEGTGLGLSVVHGIITSHGGNITVESEVGHGTTFTILLPLAQAEAGHVTESYATMMDYPQTVNEEVAP